MIARNAPDGPIVPQSNTPVRPAGVSLSVSTVAIPVTKALAAIPAAVAPKTQATVSAPASLPSASNTFGPMAATQAPVRAGASGTLPYTPPPTPTPQTPPQDAPYTPPATPPWNPSAAGLPPPVSTPYDPQASQAKYFDPNLPPQGSVPDNVPDDSHAWNDPAPVAVVSSAIQKAAVSNPGIATTQTSTALAPVQTPSLWTRILTFLGFIKPPAPAAIHGEKPALTVEQAAESIVRRIRNGDQNAMGLAVMIGDNARKGDPTAQRTFKLMEQYIGKTMGASHAGERGLDKEGANFGWAKAVYLANGPLLHDNTIADVASSFGGEAESRAFISGVLLPTHPAVSAAHHHGKILGMARKIQAVRMPNSSISDYSATVGWELGE